MPVLYLHTTESSTGGEPESDEEWCYHSDIIMSVSFDAVSRANNSFWSAGRSFEVSKEVFEADEVFLVIVRFSDGGTFGRTRGYYNVQGAFLTENEALQFAESIENGTYVKEVKQAREKSRFGSYDIYIPWVGYFSSLEGVEIHCFRIRDKIDVKTRKVVYHS